MGSVAVELAYQRIHHAMRWGTGLVVQHAFAVVQKPRCHAMTLGKALQQSKIHRAVCVATTAFSMSMRRAVVKHRAGEMSTENGSMLDRASELSAHADRHAVQQCTLTSWAGRMIMQAKGMDGGDR